MTLRDSINDFFTHCQYEKNLSQKTVKAYKIDLLQFSVFLHDKNCITEITKYDIRNYLTSISVLKPRTVKRKAATIKAFFNYLEFEDMIAINPLRKMRIKIKEPQVLFSTMDLSEIKKIFKISYRHKITAKSQFSYLMAMRNIVIVELLFATGARVSEVANLSRSNINLRTGSITIKGKGNKERVIQICNSETLSIINEYYSLFEGCINRSGGWFLLNKRNRRLSDQSIRIIIKNICHTAGIARRITPHMFRHTFGTLLLEKNVDIRYIQSMLGHSSITTTQIYTHVNNKKQRQILSAKHPRHEFSLLPKSS